MIAFPCCLPRYGNSLRIKNSFLCPMTNGAGAHVTPGIVSVAPQLQSLGAFVECARYPRVVGTSSR